MGDLLLAIPNISEGANRTAIAAVRAAYESQGAVVLDETSDVDHGRSVHTLAGTQADLASAIANGWSVASQQIDIRSSSGVHPHVGVLDVAPFVYVSPSLRGAACAAALTAAGDLGRRGASVFLYGELGGGRTRAELRRGGAVGLSERVADGVYLPDFGPSSFSLSTGAVLVAARPPLIAFNLVLASGTSLEQARQTAISLREGGSEGLPGVKALAFDLVSHGSVQLSFNIERPEQTGIDRVVEAVRERHKVETGELIGLALRRYIDAIPSDLEMLDFDPDRKSVEGSLRFNGIST